MSEAVLEPALAFIADFAPRLRRISPHFVADPRPVGGSLFRIYRDTRFSKDKTPYKTATGIQFRHELAKSAHAPGFYLHLEPRSVFVGVGIWRPDYGDARDRSALAIVEEPEEWAAVRSKGGLGRGFELRGESLKRPPAGFDAAHPLDRRPEAQGLHRRQHDLTEKAVVAKGFADELEGLFGSAAPLARFVCAATGVPY